MAWRIEDLFTAARLCSAAYELDSKDATNASGPGVQWIGQVGNLECQATIAIWNNWTAIVIRGTQVTSNLSLPELWDDAYCAPMTLADGSRVQQSVWQPLVALKPQIDAMCPPGQKLLTGHSLGGNRAQLGARLWTHAEVISFGAPPGGDNACWWKTYGAAAYSAAPPMRIVHENDFAPDWGLPWQQQPGPMQWLHNGTIQTAVARPGMNTAITNPAAIAAHSIDNAYIPALARLVAKGDHS